MPVTLFVILHQQGQKRDMLIWKNVRSRPRSAGVDSEAIVPASEREDEKHPVCIALALIFSRCGPPCEGGEGLSVHSTGGAIKSAVVNFSRSRGVAGDFKDMGNCRYSGNPGTCPQLAVLLKTLCRAQKESGSNIVKKSLPRDT